MTEDNLYPVFLGNLDTGNIQYSVSTDGHVFMQDFQTESRSKHRKKKAYKEGLFSQPMSGGIITSSEKFLNELLF